MNLPAFLANNPLVALVLAALALAMLVTAFKAIKRTARKVVLALVALNALGISVTSLPFPF